MKSALVVPVVLLIVGCGSQAQQSASQGVTVRLLQVSSTTEFSHYSGPMNIQFEVLVSNSTNEPVTLSRLDLQTIGVGPYSLRTSGTPINVKVAPKGTSSHLISVWATARGDAFTASAPVTIRGTAYFDSPSGSFLKIFSENIPPGGR